MQNKNLSLPLPDYIVPQLKFSHSLPIYPSFSPKPHPSKLVFKLDSASGFCNLVKRVSKSSSDLRKYGGLVIASCGMNASDDGNVKEDSFYIRRCVELARKAFGCTSPNPMVGCVIVKDGKIVGEGFHPKAGQPHAEVFALRDAGNLAENATAYVSLEPCNHYGRTPPCTEAFIKAKVKRVVIGMVDPNPIVASRGVDRLRDAGIDVTVSVEEQLCKRLNEAYIHQMLTGKPFLTLRYSLSINGYLLNQLGEGVTENGGYYSRLLQEYDAVIISSSLCNKFSVPVSQEPGANQPLKIIISPLGSPIQISSLTEEAASGMVIFTENGTAVEPETAQKGIETVVLNPINITAILEYCMHQGLCSVLVDLRGSFDELGELLNDSIEHNVLQKITVEVLPLWDESGHGDSLPVLESIGRRLKVNNLQSNISCQSIVLEGYL